MIFKKIICSVCLGTRMKSLKTLIYNKRLQGMAPPSPIEHSLNSKYLNSLSISLNLSPKLFLELSPKVSLKFSQKLVFLISFKFKLSLKNSLMLCIHTYTHEDPRSSF